MLFVRLRDRFLIGLNVEVLEAGHGGVEGGFIELWFCGRGVVLVVRYRLCARCCCHCRTVLVDLGILDGGGGAGLGGMHGLSLTI